MKRLGLIIAMVLACAGSACAAFNAATIWDVRSSGSDSNGGGFDAANTNFATDLAADTNTGNTSSPVVSSASYNFVAGDVGHWLYIKSGTNSFPGWYQIASVASNKATLTASLGSACLMLNNNPVALNDTAGFKVTNFNSGTAAAGIASVGTPTGLTWGIDYSQANSARISFTDMVIDGTTNTKFTSSANPVGKNCVGNIVNVTSGTGFTVQRVEVVSTSGTTATCDKSLGTLSSTGGNGALGGALASPGMAGGVKVVGNDVLVKSGTYSLSGNTANTSGCQVNDTTGGVDSTNPTWWVGWNTTRTIHNADATYPTINANLQTSLTLFTLGTSYARARNLTVDGNSKSSLTGFAQNGAYQKIDHIKAQNCTAIGLDLQGGNGVSAYSCQATGCSGTAGIRVGQTATMILHSSVASGNSTTGIASSFNTAIINCISSGNTGSSSCGFSSYSVGCNFYNCTAYGNGADGFDCSQSAGNISCINCIAEANGATGWKTGAVRGLVQLVNCAGYNNTSGNYTQSNLTDSIGFINNVTGTFFTNAASGDFSLNNTANQGALLRAAGVPGAFPGISTTGFLDIGATQHQDSGGGGSSGVSRSRAVNPR